MSYLAKHRVVHQLEEILPLKGLGGIPLQADLPLVIPQGHFSRHSLSHFPRQDSLSHFQRPHGGLLIEEGLVLGGSVLPLL